MATRSLEERVTALEETVSGLQNLPSDLAEFRRETNARFEQINAQFAHVDTRFNKLEQRMATDKVELYTHMRVLHEELIGRIKIGREGRDSGDSDAPRRSRRRPKR